MWKVLSAIVLSGAGAFIGGQIGLSKVNESLLDGTVSMFDVNRVADYSFYGAIGLPFGALIIHSGVSLTASRDRRQRLQNKGVAVVERLGFGSDVGIAVAQALEEID